MTAPPAAYAFCSRQKQTEGVVMNYIGPGFFGTDVGLAKSWKIHESVGLKFAWEVFNVTNFVRFNPNTSLDNGIADGQ
jgi:hypothetical protein